MSGYEPVLAALAWMALMVGGVYGLSRLVRVVPGVAPAAPFTGGLAAREHAVSRFHTRWYPVTMLFLAFDMEMIFMYPWTLVIRQVGTAAVVEMFVFLAVLLAGVAYAWREGALRWT
jgi:NADH-quinone oxidoreductase subunit A